MTDVVIADEQVQLVDSRNRPRGSTARRTMRRLACWHRATYVVVRSRSGQICVQQRTLQKETYPGGFDLAAGGVVGAGESSLPAARRELEEELGIRGCRLEGGHTFRFAEDGLYAFGSLYWVHHDGPLRLQASEVAAVRWLPLDEALALEMATPDTRVALTLAARENGW
ncbi:NUDIX hydrolase [Salinicola aestuarinus]|uniref:NUDIX hydrolase n=1 Tax=Salinicola aestuarinus TaxID=1949082 RepID=UPI000DA1AFCF|nr:NUDIX domain-containing protein [Salinicola aestuarinus]